MAFPKTALFPPLDQQVSFSGRALGHPARVFILRLLEEEGPKYVMELVRVLPLTEGTITEHLKKLRLAGLIDVEEQGLLNLYSLNKPGLLAMYRLQQSLFELLGVYEVSVPASEGEGNKNGGRV